MLLFGAQVIVTWRCSFFFAIPDVLRATSRLPVGQGGQQSLPGITQGKGMPTKQKKLSTSL